MKKICILIGLIALLSSCGTTVNPVDTSPSENKIDSSSQEKISVAASIVPISAVVNSIGGEYVEVENIIPAGVSPHGFDLSPKQMVSISDSQKVFMIGLEHIDGFLEKAVDENLQVHLADGMELIKVEGHDHDEHSDEEKHDIHGDEHHDADEHEDEHHDEIEKIRIYNLGYGGGFSYGVEFVFHNQDNVTTNFDGNHKDIHRIINDISDFVENNGNINIDKESIENLLTWGEDVSWENNKEGSDIHENKHDEHSEHAHDSDPHVWLGKDNIISIATKVRDELSTLLPEQASYFEANTAMFIVDIETLYSEFENTTSGENPGEFIVFHDAYNYLMVSAGIETNLKVPFSENVLHESGTAHMKELVEEVELHNIKYAFTEPQFNSGNLEKFANEYTLTIGILDPLGANENAGGYRENLKSNLENLAKIYE